MSQLEDAFSIAWSTLTRGSLPPVREFCFAPPRRWRFDFAWPTACVAVEIEGGSWMQGRHTRGAGYARDCEKYNAAVMAGWRVLRFTGEMLRADPGACIAQVVALLDG